MKNKLLAAPYIVWMAIFILVPLGIVVYYALTDSITGQFTLANLASIGSYLPIFLRSIWLSLFAALICLVIGYPVAYFIAQCRPTTQRFLEMLIMLPMCMSFLLRTLAWVAMLEDTGIFNSLLKSIGLSPLPLIRTNGAVILGMVYNYLPYMILPLYTVIMKIDRRLIEAASDLGCTPAKTFFKVELPLIMPGVISGLMLGFTLSLDDFVISHFVSSPDFQTLPLYVYNQTAHEVKYSMYALCALMVFVILGLLLAVNFAGSRGEKSKRAKGKGGIAA